MALPSRSPRKSLARQKGGAHFAPGRKNGIFPCRGTDVAIPFPRKSLARQKGGAHFAQGRKNGIFPALRQTKLSRLPRKSLARQKGGAHFAPGRKNGKHSDGNSLSSAAAMMRQPIAFVNPLDKEDAA